MSFQLVLEKFLVEVAMVVLASKLLSSGSCLARRYQVVVLVARAVVAVVVSHSVAVVAVIDRLLEEENVHDVVEIPAVVQYRCVVLFDLLAVL